MPPPSTPLKRPYKSSLDARSRKLVRNLTSGKFTTRRAALIDAGYAPTTTPSSVLNRPLVKSALTDAMRALGITDELLLTPLKEALTATRSYVHGKSGEMVETSIPDHKIRLEASRDGVAILGGIPKVGEGTPNAHGLNLFVAVDNGQGKRVEVSAHAVRSASSPSPQLSVSIQDQGTKNVQAPHHRAPLVVNPPSVPLDSNAPDPALND